MKFVAPPDLSIGRVTISNSAGQVHDWVATPGNLELPMNAAEPGYYVANIAPAGVTPQSVIFHINEGEANNVTIPPFSALMASGSGPNFLDIDDEDAALRTVYRSEPRSSEQQTSEPTPVRINATRRRISVGISQEKGPGRESFGPFAGTHSYEMVGDRVLIEVAADPSSDVWSGRRVRLSTSIEGLKTERQLLPMYRGGTRIGISPSPLASADVDYQVTPTNPKVRALVRALQAGTSREAAALSETILSPKGLLELLSPKIGDPWAAILAGLLFIRFPDNFATTHEGWFDDFINTVAWAYDTHVIHAHRVLSAAGESTEAQKAAAGRAVMLLAQAQSRGSPYYSYTNQLFAELAESLQSFLTPEPGRAKQGDSVPADPEVAKLAETVLARWRRESALQTHNGVTFTWLSRDQKALKERKILTPMRSPTGQLRARDTTVVLDAILEGGRITFRGSVDTPKPVQHVRAQSGDKQMAVATKTLGLNSTALQPGTAEIRARATTSAMTRRILRSDPNEGQFGGKAEVSGFRVDATFRQGPNKNWVTIVMTVTAGPDADIALGDVAWFDLHPTFPQRKVKVLFNERRATLSTQATGGFTLGVNLPRQEIKLECNLAKLKDAPTIIRTR